MSEAREKNGILEGVIWKQLLIFFFPIMIGSFFQQLYNTIDAVIVGRAIGKTALAAVGGSSSLIVSLIINFFVGLTSGAGVIVSHSVGAGDRKRLNDAIHTIYAFSIIGSVAFMLVGLFASKPLLEMMNTPADQMQESVTYLQIYFAGIFFVFIYNTGSSILRALGDSKRPLYYLIVCCLVNVVLDILMVLLFQMGVAGVAVATVVSQAISAVLVTRALIKSKSMCDFSLRKIKIHSDSLKKELYYGMPAGIQYSMYNISNMIVQSAVNKFGTDTTAAWAAYGKLDAIFWMISGALGMAITTFVGQNYGAGKIERVRKSVKVCLGIDIAMSIVMTLLLMVFREPLFHIFTGEAAVVEIGSAMLYFIAPFYVAYAFTEIFSGALRGLGDVVIPTLITTVGVCLIRVLWIFVIVPIYPNLYVTIANYQVTWVLSSVLFIVYYVYKIRKIGTEPKS